MPKYIECKAAINRIKEYASDVYGIDLDDANQFSGYSLAENYCEGLYEATELIDDMPAADVAPVVHGRWFYKHRHRGGIRIYEGKDEMGETRRISVDERYEIDDPYCSECGKLNESVWLNYCPHCGAKMDGGVE